MTRPTLPTSDASTADPLAPTEADLAARARADLRRGLAVGLPGGWAMAAVETAPDARLAALAAGAEASLAITDWRARALAVAPYDGDLARLEPDARGPAWMRAVADPSRDLAAPMKGPFRSLRDGDAAPHRMALALCKAARLLPAAVLARVDLPAGVTRTGPVPQADVAPVVAARVPTALAGAGRLHVFRDEGGEDAHMAVEIGHSDRSAPVLVRLHSACFTGDVLGSLKCDCGPQLHAALAAMRGPGGILLYLGQEGRGIGLANKMRAYALQDQGFDTVDANHRLGFEDDERDFRLGARLLRGLGVARVRLLTNNPAKVARLQACGIEVVERVPLRAGHGAENAAYLATKARRSGHILD
ncbi:MAG: GTP cyclohydrolase II [Paracoccaceae bacterium]